MKRSPSQTNQILQALKPGETLTPIDALNRFGRFRLAARIDDLRNAGYDVENQEPPGKAGRYRLKYQHPVPKLPPAFPVGKPNQTTLF
jgi:hypothetical protein